MEKRIRKTDALLITALIGTVMVVPLLPRTRAFLEAWAVLGLFFTAAVLLTRLLARRPARLLAFLVITFTFTFTLEAVGTATGLVFGFYRYGNALGPKLLDVPLVIGLIWCLLTLGSIRLSLALLRRLGRPGRWLTLLTAPLTCVLFDAFLEPHAGRLDYWQWRDGAAPLQNFIAWGVIAFLITGLYLWLVDQPEKNTCMTARSEPVELRMKRRGGGIQCHENRGHKR